MIDGRKSPALFSYGKVSDLQEDTIFCIDTQVQRQYTVIYGRYICVILNENIRTESCFEQTAEIGIVKA